MQIMRHIKFPLTADKANAPQVSLTNWNCIRSCKTYGDISAGVVETVDRYLILRILRETKVCCGK